MPLAASRCGGPGSCPCADVRQSRANATRLTSRRPAQIVRVNAIVLAIPIAASVPACCRSTRHASIGFWYDPGPYQLPADVTARLGGPITDDELAAIERLSRTEIERAFHGLGVDVTDARDVFWRVRVMRSLPTRAGSI